MEEDTGLVMPVEEFRGGGEEFPALHPGLLHPPPLRLGQGCLNALNFPPGVHPSTRRATPHPSGRAKPMGIK